MTVVEQQKEAAALIGVSPKGLRDWMKEPGFPDCSAGYPIDAIRRWQQTRGKKGSEDGDRLRQIKLAREGQRLRRDKAAADRQEREEQVAQGNILPRDELTLATIEHVVLARDRLMGLPKEVCRVVPKRYHRKLQEQGTKIVRTILSEFARGVQKEAKLETVQAEAPTH